MEISWGTFWEMSRGRLKSGWLIAAGLAAVYFGAVLPSDNGHSIASESGLASSVGWAPISLWRTHPLMLQKDVSFASRGRVRTVGEINEAAAYSDSASTFDETRKVVRTGSMDLLGKNPRESADKIREVAEHAGGFLVSSEVYGSDEASSASLTIRVPADQFENIRTAIRKLGLRVETDKLDAEDVTKQYVDESARLRNLRAQETQYLAILKQAKTVKDTMDVSTKLNEVRGQIEQQQTEFDALSKQVETVALTVSLQAEADTQVFGLHWRPLYQVKMAARQGIAGLGDYAAAMASFLFYIPAILLWLATILISAAIGWRILRWAGRFLFVPKVRSA